MNLTNILKTLKKVNWIINKLFEILKKKVFYYLFVNF